MGSVQLRLTATVHHADESVVLLCADGSVDASNVVVWRRLLDQAAHATSAPGRLIVDVDRLQFMGCCAFAALAEESARCRRRGIELSLVSSRGITARIVAITGLQLSLYPSVDAALDHGQANEPSAG